MIKLTFEKASLPCAIFSCLALILGPGCDNRTSVNRSKPEPTFTADITVVKDNIRQVDLADITFYRDGEVMADGVVLLNDIIIPDDNEDGRYTQSTALGILQSGLNSITFSNPDDEYSEIVTIDMPGAFEITNINPRHNSGVVDVALEWSQPDNATMIILAVVAREYPFNGTAPHVIVLDADVVTHIVPDTTFEDGSGFPVNDIYYVYLVAFNQGFGEYSGIPFPLPQGLPARRIFDPDGLARYGAVAPYDSILVLP